jgi:hypothetical protein
MIDDQLLTPATNIAPVQKGKATRVYYVEAVERAAFILTFFSAVAD